MMILVVSLAVALLFAVFLVLFHRLASRSDAADCTTEWLESFSVESYAPMERLLDEGDFTFLAAQPGYNPQIAHRLRTERRKVFAGYLRLLIADFNRLLGLAKLMVVYSAEDQTEFAKALWRQQLTFYFAVCAVRCRLALYPLGWRPVDVGRLVHSLERMRSRVRSLASEAI